MSFAQSLTAGTTAVRVAQTIGITLPAFVTGMNVAMAWTCLDPAIKHADARTLINVWQDMFDRGKVIALGMVGTGTLSWLYSAYSYGLDSPASPFVLGGLAGTVGFPIYTAIFMETGVNARLRRACVSINSGDGVSEAAVKSLRRDVSAWNGHAYVRAAIAIAGSISGIISLW